MASKEDTTVQHDKPKGAKLAEDFEPNEPSLRSGSDKDGKPNDTLSPKQLERGAVEALLSLRPQPTAEEIQKVLEELSAGRRARQAQAPGQNSQGRWAQGRRRAQ